MLGLAGALLQTIMRNPLTEPEMTGATSGAVLFAVLWLARGPGQLAEPGIVLPFVALLGGVSAGGLVYILSWRRQSIPNRLLLTAGAVALVGGITFLGLIAPHSARRIVGSDARRLFPFSMVLGAILLLAADAVAQSVSQPALPVGAVLALLGAPFFLYLVCRRMS